MSYGRTTWSAVWARIAPKLIIIAIQWILAMFILHADSLGFGALFGLLSPFWLFPLGYCIARFVTSDAILVRTLGGLLGGLIGAAVAHAISDWGTNLGLVFGAYFGGIIAGYFSAPEKPTRIAWAVLQTVLLMSGLGVFKHLDFFLDPPPEAFLASVTTVAFAVLILFLLRQLQLTRQSRRQRLAEESDLEENLDDEDVSGRIEQS